MRFQRVSFAAIAVLIVLGYILALPAPVASFHEGSEEHAEAPTPAPGFLGGFETVEGEREDAGIAEGSLLDLLFQALRVALIFLAVIALAALIWGGVLYIISLGNDQDIQKAKKIIIYAIVGLVVIMLAGLVVNVVINIFGLGGGTP